MQKSGASQRSLSVRSRIYRHLYQANAFCSKQGLAESCGISMPTLYQNLNALMEEGLVRYSGEDRSTGGRRARGLDIDPEARIAVGVAVAEHNLRLIAVNLRLEELAYRNVPFDMAEHLAEREAPLAEILERFLDDFGLDRSRLLGVGIGVPGLLSPDRSRITFAPTLGLRDVPMEALTGGIPYPVYVDNDASASGHAECYIRGARQNLAFISLENGVGGAVLMGGEPYAGDNARSGEFGHICVEPGGRRCTCGRSGCLEAYCSTRRIEETFGVTPEEFFRGLENHVPEYESLLYDVFRHLAVGINAIHMTLDCDIVLGGSLAEFLPPYLPILKRYVAAGDPFAPEEDFLQLSMVRRHIVPLGAALYFVREFINSI